MRRTLLFVVSLSFFMVAPGMVGSAAAQPGAGPGGPGMRGGDGPMMNPRWRARMLVDWGAERMRHRYAKHATDAEDKATAEWYAGYAALVAGDRHSLDERRIEADNAYGDAVERFLRSAAINDAYADSSHHYAVFALAGDLEVRIGHTFPLTDAAAAHTALEARSTTGKILLLP